jgi:hypothetical protein
VVWVDRPARGQIACTLTGVSPVILNVTHHNDDPGRFATPHDSPCAADMTLPSITTRAMKEGDEVEVDVSMRPFLPVFPISEFSPLTHTPSAVSRFSERLCGLRGPSSNRTRVAVRYGAWTAHRAVPTLSFCLTNRTVGVR